MQIFCNEQDEKTYQWHAANKNLENVDECFYKASEEWLQINDKLNTLSLQEKMEIWLYRVRDALEKSMTKKQDFKLDTGEY